MSRDLGTRKQHKSIQMYNTPTRITIVHEIFHFPRHTRRQHRQDHDNDKNDGIILECQFLLRGGYIVVLQSAWGETEVFETFTNEI